MSLKISWCEFWRRWDRILLDAIAEPGRTRNPLDGLHSISFADDGVHLTGKEPTPCA